MFDKRASRRADHEINKESVIIKMPSLLPRQQERNAGAACLTATLFAFVFQKRTADETMAHLMPSGSFREEVRKAAAALMRAFCSCGAVPPAWLRIDTYQPSDQQRNFLDCSEKAAWEWRLREDDFVRCGLADSGNGASTRKGSVPGHMNPTWHVRILPSGGEKEAACNCNIVRLL